MFFWSVYAADGPATPSERGDTLNNIFSNPKFGQIRSSEPPGNHDLWTQITKIRDFLLWASIECIFALRRSCGTICSMNTSEDHIRQTFWHFKWCLCHSRVLKLACEPLFPKSGRSWWWLPIPSCIGYIDLLAHIIIPATRNIMPELSFQNIMETPTI